MARPAYPVCWLRPACASGSCAGRRARSALGAALLLAAVACAFGGCFWAFTLPSTGEAPSRRPDGFPATAYQPIAAPRSAGVSGGQGALARLAAWAVAAAFGLGLMIATQPASAWTRLGIEPTNITSFDKFVDRLEKQFIPLQRALNGAEESVEEKKAEVERIEQAEAVLTKMEAQETAVLESKPPVSDPFAQDSAATLKKEEKAVQVLEQVVEEMKQQATDPAEKEVLDKIEKQAETAEAQIVQDEAKAPAPEPKQAPKEVPKMEAPAAEPKQEAQEAPKADVEKAPAPPPAPEAKQEAKEAPKVEVEDETKAPAEPTQEAKEAPKADVEKAPVPTPVPEAKQEAKQEAKEASKEALPKEEAIPSPPAETPKEAAAILKEEEKVMEALEDKKKAAQEAQRIAEAQVEKIKEEIVVETKIEESVLKEVKFLDISGFEGRRSSVNGRWCRVSESSGSTGAGNQRSVYKKDGKRLYLNVNDCGELQISQRVTGDCSGFARQKSKGKWEIDGSIVEGKVKVRLASALTLKKGDSVQVSQDFKSDDEGDVKLTKGLIGVVTEIDSDGDAGITFDGVKGQVFVFKENWDKLKRP